MKSFLSLVVLLISTVSHHVVSSFSSSTTTTSQHAGNNKSNKNRILVISPPGDTVGQVAAVETACLGHDVKWFIVSLEPHKRKFGELKLSSGESGGGKRLRTNEPSTNRLKKKKSWRQPPRSWTRNIKKIGPPEERSGVRAAIAEFQQLRRVSEEEILVTTYTKKEPTLISNPTMCRLNLLLPKPSHLISLVVLQSFRLRLAFCCTRMIFLYAPSGRNQQSSSQNLQRLMIPDLLDMNGISTTRIGVYDAPYECRIAHDTTGSPRMGPRYLSHSIQYD